MSEGDVFAADEEAESAMEKEANEAAAAAAAPSAAMAANVQRLFDEDTAEGDDSGALGQMESLMTTEEATAAVA